MIRSFKLDDIEYVIHSHYEIYRKEYNFDLSFKEYIVDTVGNFLKKFDSSKENLWILEINQQPKGSIGIVKVDETSAQLRWFLIEPDVRGRGFGSELVQTAIDFCREKRYKTIFLWTNSELTTARRIYEKYGFKITETKRKKLSNQDLIEERWELSL